MANPVMIDIPVDTWVKVADSVKSATIHKQIKSRVAYFHNYRDEDDPAPVVGGDDEIYWGTNTLTFNTTIDSDFYILCRGKAGRVRVEI